MNLYADFADTTDRARRLAVFVRKAEDMLGLPLDGDRLDRAQDAFAEGCSVVEFVLDTFAAMADAA